MRVSVERSRQPELAAVPIVIYRPGGRPLVLEGCAEAEAVGVGEGMLVSRALSLCPRAVALPADEEAYRQEQERSLQPLLYLTPEVESAGLGLAFMGLRGLERLIGDERAVAEYLSPTPSPATGRGGSPLPAFWEGGLGGLGPPRLGIADGRFAAEMAARHGGRPLCIVPAGEERAFLSRLPLAVLPAPDAEWRELQRRLRLLGFSRLGDVAALGKVAMQAQFGAAGLAAWRLASGEPASPRFSPPLPLVEARRQFEAPLSAWPDVEEVLSGLVAELAAALRCQGWACAGLWLTWQAEGGREESRRLPLKEPAAAVGIILTAARRCLQGALEAPLSELGLRAEALVPQRGKQMALLQGRKPGGRLEQVAAELQGRMGGAAICRVQRLAASPLEERTYALRGV